MTLKGSEAVAVNAVLSDAIKELQILINLTDIKSKNVSSLFNHLKKVHHDGVDLGFDEKWIAHLNKVLKKYSCSSGQNLCKSDRRHISTQCNNNSSSEGPTLATKIEISYNSASYTEKLKTETLRLIEILSLVASEIMEFGTFKGLEKAVNMEESKLKEIENIIKVEKQSQEKIKELKNKVENKTDEGFKLMKQSKEVIAHLKDQIQEMKARTIMEEKYFIRYSNVRLEEIERQYKAKEQEIKKEIEKVNFQKDQEERVHVEAKSYLADHLAYLDKHGEYWKDKIEQDIIELTIKLNKLKSDKEKGLNHLKELTSLYQEYEAVVLADRIEKERARQQQQQKELELEASQKIQNWWRTMCVLHSLGPYGKKKRQTKRTKGRKRKGK